MNAKFGIRVNRGLAISGIPNADGVRPFSEILKDAVKLAGFVDLKAFALAKGFTQPQMSRLTTGARQPTLKMLNRLADALALQGQAREELIESAHLARATPEVRQLVARLRADLEHTRENQVRIVAHLRSVGHKLPKGLGDV